MGPTLHDGPAVADIEAIDCPLKRTKAITEIARRCGTLPTALYRLRRTDLLALRRERDEAGRPRYSAGSIAIRVGLSRARIFQLTRAAEHRHAEETI